MDMIRGKLKKLAKKIDEQLIWLGKNLYLISKFFDNRLILLGEKIYFLDAYLHQKLNKVRDKIKAIRVFSIRLSLKSLSATMLLALICTQVFGLQAFEAHIINVTAQIVNDIPDIDPPGGQFCLYDKVEVTLSVTLPGAGIYYTTNGSDPDCYIPNGTLYTGLFPLTSSATVRARSCHDSQQSAIASWAFDFAIEYCDPEEMLKINKVYYDVDSEHGEEGDNEWVEIYNPNNMAVDISNWNIKDNNQNDVIPASDPIPAHGFAVITGQSSTWDYWEIPDEVVKIVLDSYIGNGLSNISDRVILMTPDTSIVDMMSYGGDTFAFDPSCPDVDEGHMLARVPTGYDTDTAADWQDLAPPGVELTYPVGGEIWWVGHHYDITWNATNPNGDDNEIGIDLYYSADSGSTWANIVQDTANDGVFNWRVPLHINGYYVPSDQARIKVVAIGPENFMVQDQDESEDFCPPIDYDLLTEEELAYLESLDLSGDMETSSTTADEAGESANSNASDSTPDNTASASSTEDGIANTQEENLASSTDDTVAGTSTEEVLASTTDETAAETNAEETSASSTDETATEIGTEETSASSTDDIMPADSPEPQPEADEPLAQDPEPIMEPDPQPEADQPADEIDPTPTPADDPADEPSYASDEATAGKPETNNEPLSE